jgi:hypothetical protein
VVAVKFDASTVTMKVFGDHAVVHMASFDDHDDGSVTLSIEASVSAETKRRAVHGFMSVDLRSGGGSYLLKREVVELKNLATKLAEELDQLRAQLAQRTLRLEDLPEIPDALPEDEDTA